MPSRAEFNILEVAILIDPANKAIPTNVKKKKHEKQNHCSKSQDVNAEFRTRGNRREEGAHRDGGGLEVEEAEEERVLLKSSSESACCMSYNSFHLFPPALLCCRFRITLNVSSPSSPRDSPVPLFSSFVSLLDCAGFFPFSRFPPPRLLPVASFSSSSRAAADLAATLHDPCVHTTALHSSPSRPLVHRAGAGRQPSVGPSVAPRGLKRSPTEDGVQKAFFFFFARARV